MTHDVHARDAATPTLCLKGLTKHYGAVRALDGVDMTVPAGQVIALVGDNGAGKSSLVKAVSGASPATGGVIEFQGREVRVTSPRDARDLGIATVFQDLALCDNLDVVANLYLGRPRLTRLGRALGWRDEPAMEVRTVHLLRSLSLTISSVRVKVAELSGGQRQCVAIARSLLDEPALVILDEPTAALGVSQTAQVLALVRQLKHAGQTVIIISHNLQDVFAVADRIEVLRLGRNAGSFVRADTTPAEVVAAITGARYADEYGLGGAGESPESSPRSEVVA